MAKQTFTLWIFTLHIFMNTTKEMELKQRFVLRIKNYNEYSALDISYINNCIIVFTAFLYFKILAI